MITMMLSSRVTMTPDDSPRSGIRPSPITITITALGQIVSGHELLL
jgi:hypothetical protein